MSRVIIHVDMDYFYAAVEERENPILKNKAVVVCMYSTRGDEGGAVSTCNYIARKNGVHSGMPCKQAHKYLQSSDAVFLPVRKQYYEQISQKIMKIIHSYADKDDSFEKISIDEAFIDISEKCNNDFTKAEIIAKQIKNDILMSERITCSIGIGPNKLIAKIASSFEKPDGLTIIEPQNMQTFLENMPVKKLWGVGKVTETKLISMNIKTIGQLANYDILELITAFGKNRGTWLKNAALGMDESSVNQKSDTDQIGRMTSLKENSRDEKLIIGILDELIDDIINKTTLRRVSFKSITVTVIYSNFRISTKSKILNHPINDKNILIRIARELIIQFLENDGPNIRRIGITVGNLQQNNNQKSLFEFK